MILAASIGGARDAGRRDTRGSTLLVAGIESITVSGRRGATALIASIGTTAVSGTIPMGLAAVEGERGGGRL